MTSATYDSIYLSPHLDDVALSCGGQVFMLAGAGKSVLIVNVMAGDPTRRVVSDFAQAMHERWELNHDAAADRREEDARACAILGADALYWQFPDCIYRFAETSGASLYNSDAEIFGAIRDEEAYLIDQLAHQIAGLPAHNRLVVPLGVGNHVDHQLTRMAAQRAHPQDLFYYDDFPYAAVPGALEAVISLEDKAWQPAVVPLSGDALAAKVQAIAAYESQIGTLFYDVGTMEEAVLRFDELLGGERIWSRTSA